MRFSPCTLSSQLIAQTARSVLCQLTSGGNQLLISRSFDHLSSSSLVTATVAAAVYRYWRGTAPPNHTCGVHNIRCFTSQAMLNHLPFFACGEVVKGFGRGSKELGIPTANYPLEVVKSLPPALHQGIYYGWANVNNGEVYKMVMSIGTNPYYDNKEKSMETHILHDFNCDLYGQLLKVCIVGYLRPEKNFKSLEELIAAIRCDIETAKTLLDSNEESLRLKDSDYFNGCNNNNNSQ